MHDHRDAAVFGDLSSLFVDHAELAPQGPGPDRDRLVRNFRDGVGHSEDVDDVDRHPYVGEAADALFAEHLGLARIDRDDVVAVTLQVVADEVARPQVIAREPHDRDCVRAGWSAWDGEGALVALEVRHPIRSSPCSRSQIRSSTDSVPTDSRIVTGPTPAASSSASLSCRWVVRAGWMTRLLESPTLARCDQSLRPRISSCPPARPPAHSNEKTAPGPRGRYFSTSGRYLLAGRPP